MSREDLRVVGSTQPDPTVDVESLHDARDLAGRVHPLLPVTAGAADRERREWKEEREGLLAQIEALHEELRQARASGGGADDGGNASFRKIRELTELRDTLLEDVERGRAELGLREERLRETELDHSALRQQLADAGRDNRRLQKELGQLIDRVFEQDDLLGGDDKMLELRREVERQRQDNSRLRRRLRAVGIEDDGADDDDESPGPSQSLGDELARTLSERDEARTEMNALEEQLRRVWAEMDIVARELDAAREDANELGDLRREHRALQMQHEDLQRLIDDLRAQLRALREQGGGVESYEREMAIARQLLDGLEHQCQRAESRAAAYKMELVELRAANAELRKHLSAMARRVTAGGWGNAGGRDRSKR